MRLGAKKRNFSTGLKSLLVICVFYTAPIIPSLRADFIGDMLDSTADSQRRLAIMEARKGNYDEALKHIAAAMAKDGKNPSVICDQTAILYMAGKYNEALEAFKSLPSNWTPPPYMEPIVAICLYKAGRRDDGIKALEKAYSARPDDRNLAETLLSALLEAGQAGQAIELCDALSKRMPDAPWMLPMRARALRLRGVELARNGNYEEADMAFKSALALEPDSQAINYDRMTALSWSGKHREAVGLYEKLPQSPPPPPYVEKAAAKSYLSLENPGKAAEICKSMATHGAADADTLKILVSALISMGSFDEAGKLIQNSGAALDECRPALASAMRLKGVSLAREGKFDEAEKVLIKAIEEGAGPEALCDRMTALSWAGKHREATALAKELPKDFKPPAYLLRELAKSHLSLGEADAASGLAAKALELAPDDTAAVELLFKAQLMKKDFDAAAKTLEGMGAKGEQLKQSLAEAMRDEAVAKARAGSTGAALRLLERAASVAPADPLVKCDMIAVLSWAERHEEAIKEFESLPEGFAPPDYVYPELARSYREASKFDKALKAYTAILEKDDSRTDAAVMSLSILAGSGEAGKAEEFMSERLKRHPKEEARLRRALVEAMKTKAVDLARKGESDKALELIKKALKESGGDRKIAADYLTLLMWAGLYKEAAGFFKGLPPAERLQLPGYALEAAAKSLRESGDYPEAKETSLKALELAPFSKGAELNYLISVIKVGEVEEAVKFVESRERIAGRPNPSLEALLGDAFQDAGKPDDAKAAYEKALSVSPGNPEALAGMGRLALKAGRWNEAKSYAEKALSSDAGNTGALHCLAEALEKLDDFMGAYNCYERIIQLEGGRQAVDAKYGLLADLGASGLAFERMKKDKETPSQAVMERLLGDEAAERINWKDAKSAKAILERNVSDASPYMSTRLRVRSRYDSFLASRQLEEMRKILSDYEALLKEEPAPPFWVQQAAADACLYLRMPERALELYKEVERKREEAGLGKYPDNFDIKMAIYFTLIELERYKEAGKALDELDEAIRPFQIQRGATQANWDKASVEIERAWWLIFQDRLADAEEYLDGLMERASFNTNIRTAQAYLHYYRDWPRRALEDFQIVTATDPKDKAGQIGLAYALNANDKWKEARALASELKDKFPDDLAVQKLNRSLELEEMRKETISFEYSQEQGQSDGFTLSQRLDQPVYPHRNAYVETVWKHIIRGDDDGDNVPKTKEIFRNGAGIDWRVCRDLTIRGGGSIDYQAKHPAGSAGFDYSPDDHWTLSADYTSYSLDAPAWILLDDGYAQEYSTVLKYRYSEDFNAMAGFSQMFASDHNIISTWTARQDKAITTGAYWKTRFALEEELTVNSMTDVDYYSPRYNAFVYAVPNVEHLWYRRYDFSIVDRLYVAPGVQFEKDHGANFAGYVRYEQEWSLNDSTSFVAGVTGSKRNYDGDRSFGLSVYTTLVFHF